MATIRPFRALRPVPEAAAAVASVPYDVVDTAGARERAAGNPLSFLRVTRAEIDLPPGTDPYADTVYRRAAANLGELGRRAPLVVDDAPSLYLYRLRAGSHEQTGVAGCFSLAEYERHVVKRHEKTRPDKEDDRTRHMLALGAQTGIVFLAYRAAEAVDAVVRRGTGGPPLLDVAAADGVRHTVWRLGPADTAALVEAFAAVPSLYIADGHHRVASAARARDGLGPAVAADAEAPAHFFLAAAFPDSETRILSYNRTVADLGDRTPEAFVEAVRARFAARAVEPPANVPPPRGRWTSISPGAGTASIWDRGARPPTCRAGPTDSTWRDCTTGCSARCSGSATCAVTRASRSSAEPAGPRRSSARSTAAPRPSLSRSRRSRPPSCWPCPTRAR